VDTRTLRRAPIVAAAALCCLVLPALAHAKVTLPPANGQFDYQLGGPYPPAASVAIVDRDRTAAPAAGKYNICYINAFQAQTDEAAWWKTHHDDLLLKDRRGRYVIDPGWNEILFDVRTAAKRTRLARIENRWMTACAARGFEAVEPDNLDSWTRSQKLLTRSQSIAFATVLARDAHAAGLAIAQKNTSEIAAQGRHRIGFDFAIAEECQVYTGRFGRECDDYTHYYGNLVYEIEYTDNGGLANYEAACAARGASISIVYPAPNIVPAGAPGYTYRAC
jgi:hypothetical protein